MASRRGLLSTAGRLLRASASASALASRPAAAALLQLGHLGAAGASPLSPQAGASLARWSPSRGFAASIIPGTGDEVVVDLSKSLADEIAYEKDSYAVDVSPAARGEGGPSVTGC